jgi:hypothetical protein
MADPPCLVSPKALRRGVVLYCCFCCDGRKACVRVYDEQFGQGRVRSARREDACSVVRTAASMVVVVILKR